MGFIEATLDKKIQTYYLSFVDGNNIIASYKEQNSILNIKEITVENTPVNIPMLLNNLYDINYERTIYESFLFHLITLRLTQEKIQLQKENRELIATNIQAKKLNEAATKKLKSKNIIDKRLIRTYGLKRIPFRISE